MHQLIENSNYLYIVNTSIMKQVFSTGDVSKICEVSPKTVSKWIDAGKLRGYSVPDSRHRRIQRKSLFNFLKESGFPDEMIDACRTKILLVTNDQSIIDSQTSMKTQKMVLPIVKVSSCGFTAAMNIRSWHPDCAVIDVEIGDQTVEKTLRALRKSASICIGLESTQKQFSDKCRGLLLDVFRKPFDTKLLTDRMYSLLQMEG
jgi:hypothetical protein